MAQFTLQLDPANGPVLTALLGVSLPRADALTAAALPVTATDFAAQGIDALIGRDVLRDCILIYNGSVGSSPWPSDRQSDISG